MTDAIEIEDYSKRTVFVRLVDTKQMKKWNKIIKQIGGTAVNSESEPGWLLTKTKVAELEDAIDRVG